MTSGYRWLSTSFLALTVCLIILSVSNNGESKEKQGTQSIKKGSNPTMRTYPIGRFSISLPLNFDCTSQLYRFRDCYINEFLWRENAYNEQNIEQVWNSHLSKLNMRRKPDGTDSLKIENRKLPELSPTAKGILYYESYLTNRRGTWEILIEKGRAGVWFKCSGPLKAKEEILKWVIDIAKAYSTYPPNAPFTLPTGNWFYTKYGAVNLPFFEQEEIKASFYYPPLELRLEIEMNDTHVAEAPEEGLIGRTTAVIATGYAGNVEIERIRSRKRQIAGLKGEEEVDRLSHQGKIELDFGWRYAGEKNSGERPEILITMESPDGNLDEKMKIWDAILDSFKPAYNTAR